MGTLSKALASCGGYVAGQATLVSYLRHSAPGFVYSTGLGPSAAAAALAALHRLHDEPDRVRIAPERASRFRELVQRCGWNTGTSQDGSAIVPVIVGDSAATLRLANRLRRGGISVPPIVHPAVAKDQARLRFFFTAAHTNAHVQRAADALASLTEEAAGENDRSIVA
jgi:8-amino-7-oxononanoate synthase